MSRFTQRTEDNKEIAYGFDHALGWWFDVFETDEHGEEETIVEESTTLTKLTHGKMLELMTAWGVNNEQHLESVAMDLPI